MAPNKSFRTYSRGNNSSVSSAFALNVLFATNLTKRKLHSKHQQDRKFKYEVKNLPEKVQSVFLDESSLKVNVNVDDTFDRLRESGKKVEVLLDDKSIKAVRTSPSADNENSHKKFLDMYFNQETLPGEGITKSLSIEVVPRPRHNKSTNVSIPNALFTNSVREQMFLHCSTPIQHNSKMKLVNQPISPINSKTEVASCILQSISEIDGWNRTLPDDQVKKPEYIEEINSEVQKQTQITKNFTMSIEEFQKFHNSFQSKSGSDKRHGMTVKEFQSFFDSYENQSVQSNIFVSHRKHKHKIGPTSARKELVVVLNNDLVKMDNKTKQLTIRLSKLPVLNKPPNKFKAKNKKQKACRKYCIKSRKSADITRDVQFDIDKSDVVESKKSCIIRRSKSEADISKIRYVVNENREQKSIEKKKYVAKILQVNDNIETSLEVDKSGHCKLSMKENSTTLFKRRLRSFTPDENPQNSHSYIAQDMSEDIFSSNDFIDKSSNETDRRGRLIKIPAIDDNQRKKSTEKQAFEVQSQRILRGRVVQLVKTSISNTSQSSSAGSSRKKTHSSLQRASIEDQTSSPVEQRFLRNRVISLPTETSKSKSSQQDEKIDPKSSNNSYNLTSQISFSELCEISSFKEQTGSSPRKTRHKSPLKDTTSSLADSIEQRFLRNRVIPVPVTEAKSSKKLDEAGKSSQSQSFFNSTVNSEDEIQIIFNSYNESTSKAGSSRRKSQRNLRQRILVEDISVAQSEELSSLPLAENSVEQRVISVPKSSKQDEEKLVGVSAMQIASHSESFFNSTGASQISQYMSISNSSSELSTTLASKARSSRKHYLSQRILRNVDDISVAQSEEFKSDNSVEQRFLRNRAISLPVTDASKLHGSESTQSESFSNKEDDISQVIQHMSNSFADFNQTPLSYQAGSSRKHSLQQIEEFAEKLKPNKSVEQRFLRNRVIPPVVTVNDLSEISSFKDQSPDLKKHNSSLQRNLRSRVITIPITDEEVSLRSKVQTSFTRSCQSQSFFSSTLNEDGTRLNSLQSMVSQSEEVSHPSKKLTDTLNPVDGTSTQHSSVENKQKGFFNSQTSDGEFSEVFHELNSGQKVVRGRSQTVVLTQTISGEQTLAELTQSFYQRRLRGRVITLTPDSDTSYQRTRRSRSVKSEHMKSRHYSDSVVTKENLSMSFTADTPNQSGPSRVPLSTIEHPSNRITLRSRHVRSNLFPPTPHKKLRFTVTNENSPLPTTANDDVFKMPVLRTGKSFRRTVLQMKRESMSFSVMSYCGTTMENTPGRSQMVLSENKKTDLPSYIFSKLAGTPQERSVEKPLPSFTARDVVLQYCNQTEPVPFEIKYPASLLQDCKKIGEGVYGEVFIYSQTTSPTIMKIIPIEGDQLVNGEKQKKFHEILSEVVTASQLSNLRFNKTNNTSAYCEVKRICCVEGRYPQRLIELWHEYDEAKESENDPPVSFPAKQLYIVLDLGNAGRDLEAFEFMNASQAIAMFKQVSFALAVAEEHLQFEHRDMHWGNVLLKNVDKVKKVAFMVNGKLRSCQSMGVEATIIDFTLSRIEHDGVVIFNDLGQDPELFEAEGDYQFDVYRLMKKRNGNNWKKFCPYTNILWLHYVLHKSITALRYKKTSTKIHQKSVETLLKYESDILKYNSVSEFVEHYL